MTEEKLMDESAGDPGLLLNRQCGRRPSRRPSRGSDQETGSDRTDEKDADARRRVKLDRVTYSYLIKKFIDADAESSQPNDCSSELNQTPATRRCYCLGPADYIELTEDTFDVCLNRSFADEQLGADLFVTLAYCHAL